MKVAFSRGGGGAGAPGWVSRCRNGVLEREGLLLVLCFGYEGCWLSCYSRCHPLLGAAFELGLDKCEYTRLFWCCLSRLGCFSSGYAKLFDAVCETWLLQCRLELFGCCLCSHDLLRHSEQHELVFVMFMQAWFRRHRRAIPLLHDASVPACCRIESGVI